MLCGHTASINDFDFSPDGRLIASASADGNLKLWATEGWEELHEYHADEVITAAAWSPDGSRIVLGTLAGDVQLLKLETFQLGPLVVTAWCDGDTRAFGCPICRKWSEVEGEALEEELNRPPETVRTVWQSLAGEALGGDLNCPHCGRRLKLNPFTINADWRPIAAAWRGTED